jgi:hypothetical protein
LASVSAAVGEATIAGDAESVVVEAMLLSPARQAPVKRVWWY